MKPDAFRLGSVLRVRKRQLDATRGKLAAALREQEREERERTRLLGAIRETSRQLHERLTGCTAAFLPAAGLALDVTSGAARAAGQRARSQDAAIEATRLELAEARQRVRGLELLEERTQQRLAAWQARRDQMTLDELGARRRGEQTR